MAGIKIVDLPALGRDLAATDLLELSLAGGTGSRKITGQEIMNASKLSVGNTPIINGTAGRLLFQGSGDVLQQSANLSWDNTSNILTLNGDINYSSYNKVIGSSSFPLGTLFSQNIRSINQINHSGGTNGLTIAGNGGSPLFRIYDNGNVIIQTGGTFTDAGFKLDVNGTARVVTSLQVGNFTVGASNPSIINTNGIVRATGGFNTRNADGNDNIFTGITGSSSLRITAANSQIVDFTNIGGNLSGNLINVVNGANAGAGTGTVNWFNNSGGIIPTASNTVAYNYFAVRPTINQGAFTGGVITGYLYDPILTSINSIHRAIHTVTGDVLFGTTSGNVGIGTSSPTAKLYLKGGTSDTFKVESTTTSLYNQFISTDGIGEFGIFNDSFYFQALSTLSNGVRFYNSTSGVMQFSQNGNLLINTTTDAGYRLDVNGTARVSGDLSVPTGKITFQTSAFGIDCNTSTGVFDIKNSAGALQTTRISFSQGTYLNIYQPTQSSTGITSGIINTISTPITYAWSSGTVQSNLFVLNPTINNTGSYSGTFRGFYYNPNLVSMTGTTHFAFHSTSGRVRFEGLPTSPTGLNAGDLWNDAGTLRIV